MKFTPIQELHKNHVIGLKQICIVPLQWHIQRITKPSINGMLNLRWYSNAKFENINCIRNKLFMHVRDELKSREVRAWTGPYEMCYIIHCKGVKSRLMDYGAVVNKMVMEALQNCKMIKNDNLQNYRGAVFIPGTYVESEPYAEVFLIAHCGLAEKKVCRN